MRLIDADLVSKQYGLDGATKYGNKNAQQQAFSYSTMMMYEIANMIDDAPTVNAIPVSVIEDIKAEISEGIDHYKHSDKAVMFGFMCALNIIDKHIEGWEE